MYDRSEIQHDVAALNDPTAFVVSGLFGASGVYTWKTDVHSSSFALIFTGVYSGLFILAISTTFQKEGPWRKVIRVVVAVS
jgi:hypothetical protein